MTTDIFGIQSLDSARQRELIRKHLINLTTSYSDEADIFTEIVQNGVDAIKAQYAVDLHEGGCLNIVIGRRKNNAHYLYVQDNGTGMSSDIVDNIFIPGFSEGKSRGHSIGYKGVGMSYVVAVANHLAVRSVLNGITVERTIMHANDWVIDSEKSEPTVSSDFQVPAKVLEMADTIQAHGTGVYFEFHAGSDPKTLDNIVVISAGIDQELLSWASFLCSKTAVGAAGLLNKEADDKITVRIMVDRGDEFRDMSFTRGSYDLDKKVLGYPFPEKVFKVGVDIDKIRSTADAKRLVVHHRKNQALFHTWSAAELVDEIDHLDPDEKSLLINHLRWVHGHLSYSTEILKTVKNKMGTRAQVVRYGARLVVDGAPQGRPLELALTSDQGLDRQTHIVLGFSELELDTGRKFVSNERILSAINKVTQRVMTRLKEYRWALKVKDRAPIEANLKEWSTSVDGRTGNSLIPALFSQLKLTAPSRVDPDNEQEVLALWTALITSRTLPGYEMRAISGFNRYDALVNVTSEALKDDGNLPVSSTDLSSKRDAVLEFKWSFDDLISDFDAKKKIPGEIDLVVCWDCPDLNLRTGALHPTYGPWSHLRETRAGSYVWTNDSVSIKFQVIALRNVVAELLDAAGNSSGSAILSLLHNRDEEKMA